jgi:hypothetical protein
VLLHYLTEIVTKKQWKEKKQYGQKIWKNIDTRIYKKSLGFIKSKIFNSANLTDKRFIFLSTNGGKATIVKYNLDENDQKLIEFINSTGIWKIPPAKARSLLSVGRVINIKEKNFQTLHDVQTSDEFSNYIQNFPFDEDDKEKQSQSRREKLEQLKKDPIKNEKAIKGIEARLEKDSKAITKKDLFDLFEAQEIRLNNLIKNKYVIVLTYDTRAVASMSTGNKDWRSCMNLDNGEYNDVVPKTISAGSFVAYLALNKDKKELSNPIARILCKSYYANDNEGNNPDIIWHVSRYYPAGEGDRHPWFAKIVEDFLNQHNKPKYRYYKLSPVHYYERPDKNYIRLEGDNLIENDLDEIKFPKHKAVAGNVGNFDDLTHQEQVEIAREVLSNGFPIAEYLDHDQIQSDVRHYVTRTLQRIFNKLTEETP